MRSNETTCLISSTRRIALVPYRREHVETYHQWMKRPELLEATASEPLSFEEELEMQRKWHLDDDKLTFIILALPASLTESLTIPTAELINQHGIMIGDVNLFLPNGKEEDVECEIMIAEDEYRGKGLAKESLSLLLHYASSLPALSVPPSAFLVRIGTSNGESIRLFENLGFKKVKVITVFDEVEMRFGRRDLPANTKAKTEEVDETVNTNANANANGVGEEQHEPEEEAARFEIMTDQEIRALIAHSWNTVGSEIYYPLDFTT